jgi:hypothetical protein
MSFLECLFWNVVLEEGVLRAGYGLSVVVPTFASFFSLIVKLSLSRSIVNLFLALGLKNSLCPSTVKQRTGIFVCVRSLLIGVVWS